MSECIDDELLAELLEGAVDDARREEIEAHVDTCSRCHATLAAFGRAFIESEADAADVPPLETVPGASGERMKVLAPDTVVAGRFRVIELVGAGGMGMVYRARDPELGRDVALKLIRTGWFTGSDPDQLRARLVREARAMARVRHANVVAIFDVGQHDGSVFLAADFIEGRTLRAWIDAEPRSSGEVLDVFVAAGEGLAAAHHAGIVHRDFKPANVLVDAHDAPFVTDFGLACGIEHDAPVPGDTAAELPTNEQVTLTGAFVGTPAYAAPEQLRGAPSPASDQFSFCVALYEGLYGHRPFAGNNLLERSASVELGRIEPASARSAPRRVHAAIVRGLAADPARRHASMSDLLTELRRSRHGWVRRFGPAVAVAATIGAAGAGYGLRGPEAPPCDGFERSLQGVWDADVRAAVATSLELDPQKNEAATEAGGLVRKALDGYADAWVASATRACERTLVRLEQSQASYDLQLRCLAERRESIRTVVEWVGELGPAEVHKAAQAAQALPPLSRCESLDPNVEPPPPGPALVALVDDAEAKLARAEVFARGGEQERARVVATEALAAAEAAGHEPTQARAHFAIAARARHTAPLEQQERELFAAIAFAARVGDERTQAEGLATLAYVVGVEGNRYVEGRRHAQMARALFARLDGSPDNADALNALGSIESTSGAPEDGLPYLERALEVGTDPATLQAALTNLAVAQFRLGRIDDATATIRTAYERAAASLGRLHPTTIEARMNLGVTSASLGDLAGASQQFEQALVEINRRGPNEFALRSTALANLGKLRVEQGRPRDALPLLDEALEIVREHPLEYALREDEIVGFIASTHDQLGEVEPAIEMFRDAWTKQRSLFPEGHPDVAHTRTLYAEALIKAGRCDEAVSHLRVALDELEAAYPSEHPQVVSTVALLKRCPAASETSQTP